MNVDYSKTGLVCGLECHQQLETGKLFCRCPSILREDKADHTVARRLRASAGETGKMDEAARQAARRAETFDYKGFHQNTCLVELDEEPPHPMDKDALDTILQVCQLCSATVVDALQVMRKTVVDGSNTSGFQRTALVGMGGHIKFNEKKIGVQSIVLEEDAARPLARRAGHVTYSLDRLGIPLIELATAPELYTPKEVKACALAIGELFRRTCKAKRGLGTIRQDINLSIKDGARVEMKGIQELELIDTYVAREQERQRNLLTLRDELKKRGVQAKDIPTKPALLTTLDASTSAVVVRGLKNGAQAWGLKLPGFSGLAGKEMQPERRFGSELADHVRVKAGLGGLFHSDELPNHGISQAEKDATAQALQCAAQDAFVLFIAEKQAAQAAAEAVAARCKQALEGVPEETRNPLPDGNTSYSRPLPGAARMYPETDRPLVLLPKARLDVLAKTLPKTVAERERTYASWQLSKNHVDGMKLSNHACLFEALVSEKVDAKTAAAYFLETLVALSRKNVPIQRLEEKHHGQLLGAVRDGRLSRPQLADVAAAWAQAPYKTIENMLSEQTPKQDTGQLRETVHAVVEKNKAMIKRKGDAAFSALMGDVMKATKGKADGKEVAKMLREEIKQNP